MKLATDFEKRFDEEIKVLLRERVGIGAVVAAFVYPFFILEDHNMFPDRLEWMGLLRLISSMVCIFGFALNKTVIGERRPFLLALMTLLVMGILKTMLNPLEVQGIGSLYFGGHSLMVVGALCLMPLSFWQAVAVAATVHLSFSIPLLIFSPSIDHTAFGVQNGLMTTFEALLIIGCHLNYKMRRREFHLRMMLYGIREQARDYA